MVRFDSGDVMLNEQAISRMSLEARRPSGVEAGGILVGRPTGSGFYVHDVLVLEDSGAGYAHFTRDEAAAQQALDHYLAGSDDPHLGWIGDWHTHPEPLGPSATDKATMGWFTRAAEHPLLLVVAALGPTREVTFHATITRRLHIGIGTRTRPADIQTGKSQRPRRVHVDPQV